MAHRTVLSTLRMLAFGGLSLAASLAQEPFARRRQRSFDFLQAPAGTNGAPRPCAWPTMRAC